MHDLNGIICFLQKHISEFAPEVLWLHFFLAFCVGFVWEEYCVKIIWSSYLLLIYFFNENIFWTLRQNTILMKTWENSHTLIDQESLAAIEAHKEYDQTCCLEAWGGPRPLTMYPSKQAHLEKSPRLPSDRCKPQQRALLKSNAHLGLFVGNDPGSLPQPSEHLEELSESTPSHGTRDIKFQRYSVRMFRSGTSWRGPFWAALGVWLLLPSDHHQRDAFI